MLNLEATYKQVRTLLNLRVEMLDGPVLRSELIDGLLTQLCASVGDFDGSQPEYVISHDPPTVGEPEPRVLSFTREEAEAAIQYWEARGVLVNAGPELAEGQWIRLAACFDDTFDCQDGHAIG